MNIGRYSLPYIQTAAEKPTLDIQHHALAAPSSVGICDYHVPSRPDTYHSPRWAEILGYSLDELPPFYQIMDWFTELIHPEDLLRVRRDYLDFIRTESENYLSEFRIKHQSGKWREVRINLEAAERNNNGRAIHVVGVMSDITEEKRAEITQQTFLKVVDQSPTCILLADLEGNITYVNPHIKELSGYSSEEILGRNLRFLQSGMTPPERYEELWNKLTAGDSWQGEFINQKKNGELYWENAHIAPVREADGSVQHYVAIKIDITLRKDLERKIRQSNVYLSSFSALREAVNSNVSSDEILRLLLGSMQTLLEGEATFTLLFSDDRKSLSWNGLDLLPAWMIAQVEETIQGPMPRTHRIDLSETSLLLNELNQNSLQLPSTPDELKELVSEFSNNQQEEKLIAAIIQKSGTQSVLTIPLRAEPVALGLLIVLRKQPLEEDERRYSGALVEGMAYAIQRRWAQRSLERGNAILKGLATASKKLLLNKTEETLPELLSLIGEAADVSSVHIFQALLSTEPDTCLQSVAAWHSSSCTRSDADVTDTASHLLPTNLESMLAKLQEGNPFHGAVRELFCPNCELQPDHGLRSVLALPIFCGEAWWGFITVNACEDKRVWLDSEISAMQNVTRTIGAMLLREVLEQSRREELLLNTALMKMSARMSGSLDLDQVLDIILEYTWDIAPHDGSQLVLMHPDSHEMEVHAFSADYARAGRSAPPLEAYALAERCNPDTAPGAILVRDVQEDPLWCANKDTAWVQSFIVAPVLHDSAIKACLIVDSSQPDHFSEKHAADLTSYASTAAIAIRNALLYRDLQNANTHLEQTVAMKIGELKLAKERVESILRNSPDGILLLDSEGIILRDNPAALEMIASGSETLVGQSVEFILPELAKEKFNAQFLAAMHHRDSSSFEIFQLVEDGIQKDIKIELNPISNENDIIQGTVCSLRDISDLKEVERMKDQFVSNVSHEMRTPITGIKLNLSLVQMNPEKAATYLTRADHELNRLNRLIEDLLRLSRMDQGQLDITLARVPLNQLVWTHVHDREGIAESRGLTISAILNDETPYVEADVGLLGQALSTLITNAINYTPQGGKILVSAVTCHANGNSRSGLRVKDTGPGISAADQLRIFDRFYRGETGRQSGSSGTGLGLAIAKKIIDQHHGRIEVESSGIPGEGAQFTIWLSACDSPLTEELS